ncbi:MAG: leucine-rich repeat domain-containing protein, partial [Mycoplasmataceae bacterium]|nr:leucine-rich repeat domain-containing protein [Mycoplasmataceae bacterium]
AFYGCNITDVSIDSSNPYFGLATNVGAAHVVVEKKEGECIKDYSHGDVIGSLAFGQLTIPNLVASIGSYAFYECSGLVGTLTIPNLVASIGSYVFSGCNFTSIDMRSFPSNGYLNHDWSYRCTNVQTFYAPSSMEWNDNDDGWDQMGTNNAQFIASLPDTGNANTWFVNNVQKNNYGQNWTFSWALV